MKKNVEVITPQFKYFEFVILQSKVHVLVDTLNVGCFFKKQHRRRLARRAPRLMMKKVLSRYYNNTVVVVLWRGDIPNQKQHQGARETIEEAKAESKWCYLQREMPSQHKKYTYICCAFSIQVESPFFVAFRYYHPISSLQGFCFSPGICIRTTMPSSFLFQKRIHNCRLIPFSTQHVSKQYVFLHGYLKVFQGKSTS